MAIRSSGATTPRSQPMNARADPARYAAVSGPAPRMACGSRSWSAGASAGLGGVVRAVGTSSQASSSRRRQSPSSSYAFLFLLAVAGYIVCLGGGGMLAAVTIISVVLGMEEVLLEAIAECPFIILKIVTFFMDPKSNLIK